MAEIDRDGGTYFQIRAVQIRVQHDDGEGEDMNRV
jgi:hypothetical protein